MPEGGEAIVACARTWLGTRFHHQGRLKKCTQHAGGVDCLGLLVGVADELGICDAQGLPIGRHDRTNYPHMPDVVFLQQRLGQLLQPVRMAEKAAGDILLLEIESRPQHMAILAGGGADWNIIHAYAPARKVVEHLFDPMWQQRVAQIYRIRT